MKKIVVLFIVLFSLQLVYGQGIHFEEGSYTEVMQKAKEQNKLLFVHMTITGCGPCHLMEQRVYPLKEVGDVYNENFVCWKVNCSEDRTGEKLSEEYDIRIFPTYAWFDPNTGKLVHDSHGSRRPADFIALAKVPFDPNRASGFLKEQYKSGNRDFELLGKLYAYYTSEGQTDKLLEIERDLVKRHGEDFSYPPLAEFYFKHVVLRKSPMSQYLLEHKKKVMKRYGKERVLNKMAELE